MKYKYIYLLVAILLGLLLRWVFVGSHPVSMYWDEAAIGYDAFAIAETGRDMHGKPWQQPILLSYGDYKAPVYVWLASLFMQLLEPSVMVVRLPSVLAGTLLIVVVYLISRELFKNDLICLFTALFMAVSPWGIHFSRIAFEANIGVLLVAISFWLLLLGLRRPYMYGLAALVAGLSVYAYFSARIVVPLMAFGVLLIYWKQLTKKHLVWIGLGGLLFLMTLIPMYKSPLYKASQQYRLSTPSLLSDTGYIDDSAKARELSGDALISRVVYHRYIFLAKLSAGNIIAHIQPDYLFLYGDPNLRHSSQQAGIMWLVSLPIFLLGIIYGIRNHRKELMLIFWLWLVFIIPAAIPFEIPHALRSLNALPLTALMLGLGMYSLVQLKWGRYYAGTFALMLIISLGIFTHDYLVHYPSRSAQSFQYGYEQISRYIDRIESDYDSVRIDEFDRLYPYVLFFTKYDPRQLSGYDLTNSSMVEFGKYRFGSITPSELSTMTNSDLVILSGSSSSLYMIKEDPLHMVNDWHDNPMFYVYTGDQLNDVE